MANWGGCGSQSNFVWSLVGRPKCFQVVQKQVSTFPYYLSLGLRIYHESMHLSIHYYRIVKWLAPVLIMKQQSQGVSMYTGK